MEGWRKSYSEERQWEGVEARHRLGGITLLRNKSFDQAGFISDTRQSCDAQTAQYNSTVVMEDTEQMVLYTRADYNNTRSTGLLE